LLETAAHGLGDHPRRNSVQSTLKFCWFPIPKQLRPCFCVRARLAVVSKKAERSAFLAAAGRGRRREATGAHSHYFRFFVSPHHSGPSPLGCGKSVKPQAPTPK
jgi:hypothetical protein